MFMNRNLYLLHSIASSLYIYHLQFHELLWHADGSRELVDGAVRVLSQQLIRQKQIDSTSKTPY